jgi:hypothetical protein
MATNYDAAVNSFYLAYYGRPADPAGLAYWSQALANNNGDFSAIIDAFSKSAEATSRFGSATPSDRIADVYQQLFNRAPDQAGLAYWTKAIETGAISVADAAIQIMNGAQSTDAQLSTLRQEAAAQFTAEVAASGTAYNGTAAIEAARVLIAAITPDTSATAIKSLVTATKSLVQTAHDNPEVITALAGSGKLTTLLTSSSGKADPVAMVEALASVGKAAASDAGALTTLKQGGGMAGLVDTLPTGASLHDVAQAADKGGLTAVVEIAKPAPVDTTPPAAPKVALVADTGMSATDHLTNNGQIRISGLEAGSTWQYSVDGKTWHAGPAANASGVALLNTTATGDQTLQVRSTDATGNVSAVTTLQYTLKTSFVPTLAFQGADGKDLAATTLVTDTDNYWVNLHGAKGAAAVGFQVSNTGKDGTWTDAKDSDPLADGPHFIRYVVTDAAGNTAATNALEVDMNKTGPATLKVALVADTGVSATDLVTSNGQVKISGLDATAVWTYSTDGGATWAVGAAANTDGVALVDLGTGEHHLQVRVYDQAGGAATFNVGALDFTVVAPTAARIAFQDVDGKDAAATSLVTNTDAYRVNLYGAKGAASIGFQVSGTGADGTWTNAKDSDPLADGTHFIRYVVTDTVGNVVPTNALKVVMDHALPGAPVVQLVQDTGASATDNVTSNSQVKISGLNATAAWSYSTDFGRTWTAGPAVNTGGNLLDLGAGDHHLLVRTFGQAGDAETYGLGSLDYTVQTAVAVRLAFQSTDGKDLMATSLLTNTDNYWVNLYGAKGAATVVFQVSDTGKDGTWVNAKDSDPLSDGTHFIRYVVTDLAGNTGTTNALEVHMDKTPPAASKVAFVNDTGASATDHVTYNGQILVSGIEAGATWQYTDDGTHWINGATPDADGKANAWLTNGQHTLQVRVVDAAGNSAVTTMPYTLEGSAPAEGLTFDHIAGGAKGSTQTALAKADLVFAYTGTIDTGATVAVQIGDGPFVAATGATIDATAKTITLHDVDLTGSDPAVTLSVTSLGGLSTYTKPVAIDGPFVSYSAQATDAGISLTSTQAGHVYLTDGSNASVQIGEAIAGTVKFGVQTTAVQGTLGVGPGTTIHTDNGIVYGLGTAGADTLKGQNVWGYDGDDHITAVGTADHSDFHITSTIYGGAGADTIDATAGGSTFVYRAVQESTVVAGDSLAGGFDTITVNTTGSATHNQVFDFGIKFDSSYTLASKTALTGTETGTQLLALINTAAAHTFHVGTVEAAYIDFGTGTGSQDVNFLVVDANADGTIDGADYVVKIVGTVDVAHSYVNGSNGHMTLPTA